MSLRRVIAKIQYNETNIKQQNNIIMNTNDEIYVGAGVEFEEGSFEQWLYRNGISDEVAEACRNYRDEIKLKLDELIINIIKKTTNV